MIKIALLILLAILILIVLFFVFFQFVVVRGNSMYPTLKDGQVLVLKRTKRINEGDIVVATSTKCPKTMIKRVVSIRVGMDSSLEYFLVGDNFKHSLDSRAFGWIPHNEIEGKIVSWKKIK